MTEDKFQELMDVMRRLRVECSWDKEQTHDSIKAATLEEAYEVVEAIEQNKTDELKDELGDLLLQVVYHSVISEEKKQSLFDVIDSSISRHTEFSKTGYAPFEEARDKVRELAKQHNLKNAKDWDEFVKSGKKPDNIGYLEDRMLDDFTQLTELYDKKFKNKPGFNRKNFINTQYVLYQFLLRYKHKCKKEDFTVLKTVDRKSFHDDVAKSCFGELGWNFTPTF